MDNKSGTGSNYRKILLRATKLFERYTHDTLDEKSRKQLEKWNPEDVPARFSVSRDMLDEGCERVTNKVFSELELERDAPRKVGFPEIYPKKRRLIPAIYYKYAAVAVILIITTFAAIYTSRDTSVRQEAAMVAGNGRLTVYTAEHKITEVTLPDGTRLHINKGSKLSYDKDKFNRKNREVWLEGEAYFDVAKDPDRLFIIHNENLQTVVRGTSFTVKAYKELDEMSIAVRTGKVEIKEDDRIIAELAPNEQLLYTKSNGSVQESHTDWEDASAWMDEKLVLRNVSMDEVLLRIKQLYGKEVVLDDDVLKNERLVISFEKGASFTSVMNAICSLYDIKYKETSPDRVIIYR